MSDTSSNNASSLEARIIGKDVQGAQGCSSRPRPKNGWVDDATAATAAAAGQAKKVLGEAAQQAWSQAGGSYLASLWIHKEGGRLARIADEKANIKAPSP